MEGSGETMTFPYRSSPDRCRKDYRDKTSFCIPNIIKSHSYVYNSCTKYCNRESTQSQNLSCSYSSTVKPHTTQQNPSTDTLQGSGSHSLSQNNQTCAMHSIMCPSMGHRDKSSASPPIFFPRLFRLILITH